MGPGISTDSTPDASATLQQRSASVPSLFTCQLDVFVFCGGRNIKYVSSHYYIQIDALSTLSSLIFRASYSLLAAAVSTVSFTNLLWHGVPPFSMNVEKTSIPHSCSPQLFTTEAVSEGLWQVKGRPLSSRVEFPTTQVHTILFHSLAGRINGYMQSLPADRRDQ